MDLLQLFGERLGELLDQHGIGPVSVVGVPTSARRRRWRGYCVPQRLAACLGLPLLSDFQCLGDPAPRKALRGFGARRAQKPAFVYQGRLEGTVVLLDDVITSGETLRYAREALLSAGAARVVCLCIARVAVGRKLN